MEFKIYGISKNNSEIVSKTIEAINYKAAYDLCRDEGINALQIDALPTNETESDIGLVI